MSLNTLWEGYSSLSTSVSVTYISRCPHPSHSAGGRISTTEGTPNSDLFSLVRVEQLSYAEVIGPVEVTCSGGSSGTCFKMGYQEGLYGTCYFFCTFTGYQSDYCSSWYVNLVNFCTIIGGI